MRSLKSNIARFRAAMFESKGIEKIFSHTSNTLTASFVIAAGLFAIRKGQQLDLLGVVDTSIAGYVVTCVGGVLLLLNLIDGLHQLTQLKQWIILQVALVFVYLMLSVRVAQLVLSFRAG